jgi:hypothetical protein
MVGDALRLVDDGAADVRFCIRAPVHSPAARTGFDIRFLNIMRSREFVRQNVRYGRTSAAYSGHLRTAADFRKLCVADVAAGQVV